LGRRENSVQTLRKKLEHSKKRKIEKNPEREEGQEEKKHRTPEFPLSKRGNVSPK